MPKDDPTLPPTPEARSIARDLMRTSRHAALAYADPHPGISRIAWGLTPEGTPLTLISALAAHFAALRGDPHCALMLGDPGPKGDPLTHPRLMLRGLAAFVPADDPARPAIRTQWLADHPKSALYIDFADFAFVRFTPTDALLNAGFARAFRLTPDDL